jgi:hypothetical protein
MKNYFVSGDWNAICDVCGTKTKASKLKKRWDGFWVCTNDFESRQPLDFLRVRPDKGSVPWSRPEATDSFLYICYIDGISASPGSMMPGCSIPGNPVISI